MTAASGIDLNNRHPERIDPVGIPRCLLVTLDNRDRKQLPHHRNRLFKQGGLAGTRRTKEIEGDNLSCLKPSPIALGKQIVFHQHIFFNGHLSGLAMTVPMVVPMTVIVVMNARITVRVAAPSIVDVNMIIALSRPAEERSPVSRASTGIAHFHSPLS